jgi:hypothetical protein
MESIRIIGRNKCPPGQNLCWCRTPRPIPKGSRMRASMTNRRALWKPQGRPTRRSLRYLWCGGVTYAQAARVGVEPHPLMRGGATLPKLAAAYHRGFLARETVTSSHGSAFGGKDLTAQLPVAEATGLPGLLFHVAFGPTARMRRPVRY